MLINILIGLALNRAVALAEIRLERAFLSKRLPACEEPIPAGAKPERIS